MNNGVSMETEPAFARAHQLFAQHPLLIDVGKVDVPKELLQALLVEWHNQTKLTATFDCTRTGRQNIVHILNYLPRRDKYSMLYLNITFCGKFYNLRLPVNCSGDCKALAAAAVSRLLSWVNQQSARTREVH
jgi:hypothetical protein